MSRHHHVEVTIRAGGFVDWTITCSAPEGTECRMWCDNGCETHGAVPDCTLTDQGYCHQTSGWFDDEIPDLYSGDRQPLRSGPVELVWEGDYYSWRYATDEDPAQGATA